MADIVDSKTRSRMMAGIRNRNTRPEILVRGQLHARGFRFRLNSSDLPGRPDLVLPKYQVAVFVHGCFWHGHQCEIFRWPKSNRQFWRKKIGGNADRDAVNMQLLADAGWSVLTIWECALRNKTDARIQTSLDRAARWIRKKKTRPGRQTIA